MPGTAEQTSFAEGSAPPRFPYPPHQQKRTSSQPAQPNPARPPAPPGLSLTSRRRPSVPPVRGPITATPKRAARALVGRNTAVAFLLMDGSCLGCLLEGRCFGLLLWWREEGMGLRVERRMGRRRMSISRLSAAAGLGGFADRPPCSCRGMVCPSKTMDRSAAWYPFRETLHCMRQEEAVGGG